LCAEVGGGRALVLELAGDAAAVRADQESLAAKLGARAAPAGAVATLRAALGGGAVRFRVAALPSELEGVRAALCAAGASTLVMPARNLAIAQFAANEAAFSGQLTAVSEAARRAGGAWRIETAPLAQRAGRELLGDADATLPLQRAIKRAYDPRGILNPGRGFGEA
jgi:FAD/FMN-containing dehydrogenase